MNRIRLIFASVLTLCVMVLIISIKDRANARSSTPTDTLDTSVAEALLPEPEPEPVLLSIDHKIKKGQTLGTILQSYKISNTSGIVTAAEAYFDLTKIQAGKTLTFTKFENEVDYLSLSYAIDQDRKLVVELGETPTARLDEAVFVKSLVTIQIHVTRTLWQDATEEGLRPGDIARLANIFQWEVDFARELQHGARFMLVADQHVREDGGSKKLGDIHAVKLENAGKTHTAIHYVQKNGEEGWFSAEGAASKRPFLRSPLKFSRVTSRFNRKRYHPVLKKTRPHLGVDYGASRGTPIRTIGAGVVKFAGRKGGYGNFITIDHSGPYVTQYAHLHKIKVRKGQRVKQGQIIGTVGSTGMSTGPHLHFEFLVRGRHVDPTKVDVPTVEPLPKSERTAFFAVRDQWLPMLEQGKDPVVAEVDTE